MTSTTTIRELEDTRYRAIVDQGLGTGSPNSATPTLAYSHSSGDTDTLDSYLDKVRSGFYVYHDIDHPIDFIRIVDDVALVVGEMNAHITAGGATRRCATGAWRCGRTPSAGLATAGLPAHPGARRLT